AGAGIIDGVARTGGEQRGKVAVVHGRRGHGVGGIVVPRARIVDAFITEQEEGLVLAVVDFRDAHRPAEGAAPAIEAEVRTRRAGFVQEKVVGPETGTL